MNFFGARGGFGFVGEAIIGDIGFDQVWSSDAWRSSTWQVGTTSWFDTSSTYIPLPAMTLEAARHQWEKLQDLVTLKAPSAARAEERMTKLRAVLGSFIAPIDTFTAQGNMQARAPLFSTINTYLAQFANEKWPEASEEIELAETQQQAAEAAAVALRAQMDLAAKNAAAQAAADQAKREQTQDAIARAQAATAEAAKAKQVAQSAVLAHQQAQQVAVAKSAALGAGLSTPLTIAAVAIPLAVVAYFALRKKSSSVGRYRRRRR